MRNDGVTVVVKKVVIALITALYDMLWDGEKAQVGVPHQVWRPMLCIRIGITTKSGSECTFIGWKIFLVRKCTPGFSVTGR